MSEKLQCSHSIWLNKKHLESYFLKIIAILGHEIQMYLYTHLFYFLKFPLKYINIGFPPPVPTSRYTLSHKKCLKVFCAQHNLLSY